MMTYEALHERLVYDPESGDIYWRNPYGKACNNRTAGTVLSSGHRRIIVDGEGLLAHRVAWLLTYKEWPVKLIDHIDGNPDNNRLSNLREADYSENGANRKNNKGRSLPKGVGRDGNRYKARITRHGVYMHIGCYGTVEEAHKAYLEAAKSTFGNYAKTI